MNSPHEFSLCGLSVPLHLSVEIGPLNPISSIIDANERPNSMAIQTFDRYVAVNQQNVYNAFRMHALSLSLHLHSVFILENHFDHFISVFYGLISVKV